MSVRKVAGRCPVTGAGAVGSGIVLSCNKATTADHLYDAAMESAVVCPLVAMVLLRASVRASDRRDVLQPGAPGSHANETVLRDRPGGVRCAQSRRQPAH